MLSCQVEKLVTKKIIQRFQQEFCRYSNKGIGSFLRENIKQGFAIVMFGESGSLKKILHFKVSLVGIVQILDLLFSIVDRNCLVKKEKAKKVGLTLVFT